VTNLAREEGFTLTELLISATIMLLVTGAALTTFKNALNVNETAGQLADANQNLRAGTNQLVRDLMMAGRIIAGGGVPVPSGNGVSAINRPSPPGGTTLTFSLVADADGVMNLPSITHGYQLGPTINGTKTDMVTILTVDEFMPTIQGQGSGTPTGLQGTISADGSQVTFPSTSPWLVGDTTNDTAPINVGDLVLFKNANGSAMQVVTQKDSTHIFFAHDSNDWFNLNQRNSSFNGTVHCIKAPSACDSLSATPPTNIPNSVITANFPPTSLLRAMMITYYVDNTTTPGTPRLTRVLNHYTPQALAGVVEDLDLTYDLVDPSSNSVTDIKSLPYTDAATGVTYTSSMIKKVNIHVGVRSETLSKPSQDYVRNHITTAVDVRSLASIDRYNNSQ
jgi:type II secretory pathway pseudopilin PulG